MSKLDTLVEIYLAKEEDFLKVKETLTRIGIASKKDKIVYQSCHILHKQGKYYLVHFKELFILDGKPTNFDEKDTARRNTIANLLHEWGLVKLASPEVTADPISPLNQIKVLSFKDKGDWTLVPKYSIGKK
jgi:hypothetical protein